MINKDNPEAVKINYLVKIDNFGRWNNHPILCVHEDEHLSSKIIGARARLQNYRFMVRMLGKKTVDAPSMVPMFEGEMSVF
jgi:hypothetical protein